MRKFLRAFIVAICLILPATVCLIACDGENETAKISSFSVGLENTSYTLVEDTITVTYGEDYRLLLSDFSVTATFDDETSKTLISSELSDYGFTFESNIPNSAKTPVGTYEISIKHEDVETSKTISLVVEKATINYSESDIVWSESEFAYDGTEKTVTITNLPNTLKATYQNNTKTSPEEYKTTATISAKDSDNYSFTEITVEHTWEIELVNHTITYTNTHDLENRNQTTYTLLSETITLTPLTGRNYYTFDGWYYNNEKITTIPKGFTGGNITLEAKWTPIVYTITYQDTKDTVNPNPTTYTIEDGTITLTPLANRVDYTFVRWERVYDEQYKVDISPTTTISATDNKGNLTLKAVWDKKTEYDAFEYTVSEGGTQATITGLNNTSSTEITIPKGVVAIGNSAFKDCTTLSTVQFEEESQLLTIGDYAFSGCISLSNITIPARVTTFGNNAFERSGLRKMNFSENGNLTTLGNSVFYDCAGLTEFTIPDTVVSMGKFVFSSCIYLTKIVFGKGMTVIGEYVYGGSGVLREIEFKGEITSFHKNAFASIATKNITLTLNMNQKNLEQRVYAIIGGGSGCSDEYYAENSYYRDSGNTTSFCGKNFQSVGFCCDVTDMTAETFSEKLIAYDKTDFTNYKFVLPANADDYFSPIKTFVSRYKSGTVTLTIAGVTSIPQKAFMECYALNKIVIGENVKNVEYGAFYYCTNLKSAIISNSVTEIGEYCFCACKKLDTVKLSSSLTEIGNYSFSGCDALESLTVYDGLRRIGNNALYGCEKLESVVISKSVITISLSAFGECNLLTKVYYAGTKLEWQLVTIGTGNECVTNATIYYYSESKPSTTGNYWHYENGVPTAWQ